MAELLPIPTESLYESLGNPEVVIKRGEVTYDLAQASMLFDVLHRRRGWTSTDTLIRRANARTPAGKAKQVRDFIWSMACDMSLPGDLEWRLPDNRQIELRLTPQDNTSFPDMGEDEPAGNDSAPLRQREQLFKIAPDGSVIQPKFGINTLDQRERSALRYLLTYAGHDVGWQALHSIIDAPTKKANSNVVSALVRKIKVIPALSEQYSVTRAGKHSRHRIDYFPERDAMLVALITADEQAASGRRFSKPQADDRESSELTSDNIWPRPLRGIALARAVAAARGETNAHTYALSPMFQIALDHSRIKETKLTTSGLRILSDDYEEHLFVGGHHIALPRVTLKILRALSLAPQGLTHNAISETMRAVFQYPISPTNLQNHLDYLDDTLTKIDTLIGGKTTLVQEPFEGQDTQTVYRINGLLGGESSEGRANWANTQPEAEGEDLFQMVS